MAPRVIILTEKPSVARDIARATGHFRTGKEYFTGKWDGREAALTWAVGHLCELAPPDVYDPRYKRWSLADLPIIPDTFRLQVAPAAAARFAVVAKLMAHPDVELIINACDAGREGELIFRQIYELAGAKAAVKRLWISSLTDEAIRNGLAALRPGAEFDALGAAARLRSQADWLIGLNATRAVTKRAGDLYSVGRVQTPTLALLVQREHEIAQFAKQKYFHVRATFTGQPGTYTGLWLGPEAATTLGAGADGAVAAGVSGDEATSDQVQPARLQTEAEAAAIATKVNGETGAVVRVDRRERSQLPPLLFDLTSLQREMNARHGMSASKTLALAQELYEKDKAITYPRTDSRYLTRDLVPTLRGVLRAVAAHPAGTGAAAVLARETLPISGRLVNAARVTDHHAIIPTTRVPARLPREKALVYEAIVRQFVAAFYPPARLETARIWTAVAGELFYSRATVVTEPGWMAVSGRRGEEEQPLPPVQEQDRVSCHGAEPVAGETRPPARYTEATLLRAMETAGRHLDENLPDAAALAAMLRENGLGTPATRAAIIERLIQVGYVRRVKKALVPTPKGIGLIQSLADTDLVSPALTGRWEQRLQAVERGELSEAEVRAAFIAYTHDLVATLRQLQPPPAAVRQTAASVAADNDGRTSGAARAAAGNRSDNARTRSDTAGTRSGAAVGRCPQCGGDVRLNGRRYACAGHSGRACRFGLPLQLLGQTLTEADVKALLSGRRTRVMSGLRSKTGKLFAASLSLDRQGNLQFHFRQRGKGTDRRG